MNDVQKAVYEALKEDGWDLVWEIFKGNTVLLKKDMVEYILYAIISENGELNFNRNYNA